MSQGFTKGIPVDADATMSANSAFLVPSQSAVRAYVGSYSGAANNSALLGGLPASSYALKADLIPGFITANAAFDTANAALPNTSGVSFGGNLTIAGNLAITGAISNTDFIQFNLYDTIPAATSNGRLSWNTNENTLDLTVDYINGTTLQIGQEQYIKVKNQSGATIFNGNVVMQDGTVGSSGIIRATLANANGYYDSRLVIGLATQDIPNGGDGYVTTFGKVRGLNTNRFNEGDLIYIDPAIPGGLINTSPTAPNNKTIIGTVITKSATVGEYLIRPVYGSSLFQDEHAEFTNITNGDMIVFTSANNRFENRAQTALLPYTVAASAFDKANAANVLAYNTGIGANAWSNVSTSIANTWANTVAVNANNWSNAYANSVGTRANAWANSVGTAANAWSNSVGTAANSFASATIAGANTISIAAFNKANAALPNTSGVSFVGDLNFPNGNIAVGIATTTYRLEVAGSFAAQTKSFVINHPTKPGMKLRYGSLEGPENGVYVRGRVQGPYIYLPDYWEHLVDKNSITVQLTPIHNTKVPSVLSWDNQKIVLDHSHLIDCFYHVYGERKDVEKLVVEF